MAENSKIQWTHHTFNPWRGCTKISPGCTNCYAETMSHRNPKVLGIWGDKGTRVVAAESYWREPVKWNRAAAEAGERRRVFCASLADIFEERPELEAPRQRLFDLILSTPYLDWLILTKRPRHMKEWLTGNGMFSNRHTWGDGWANVWLGTSVEDQERFRERATVLCSIPAAVRFLSIEPQIGPVDLGETIYHRHGRNPVKTWEGGRINWVIVGGESGHGARAFDPMWARKIIADCKSANVPVFMKQMGANAMQFADSLPAPGQSPESVMAHGEYDPEPFELKLIDKKGGDMEEWPEYLKDLRVREFPVMATKE